LNSDEVGENERNIVIALKHLDDSRMINARDKDGQQIGEQFGLFLEVEGQGTVISKGGLKSIIHRKAHYFLHLDVRNLDDDLLKWLCSHAFGDRSIIARAALSNSSYLT
jgi:hypothetical protein